jgi:hypothetical protein
VGWSQIMPIWVVLLVRGASLHHSPVSTLRSTAVSYGSMGLVLLRLSGWKARYCSGAVPPVPLPTVAGLLLLSLRT